MILTVQIGCALEVIERLVSGIKFASSRDELKPDFTLLAVQRVWTSILHGFGGQIFDGISGAGALPSLQGRIRACHSKLN